MMLGLCACAGNPPDWWNPSGAYGNATVNKPAKATTVSGKPVAPRKTQAEIPTEETIETSVEEYEEINLNPIEQTEQSGSTDDGTEQADPMYAPAEEHLPADGSLPMPSVLE